MTTLAIPTAIPARRTLSSFEFWPGWIFYIPVVVFWILMGIRFRSFTLPTAANPHVETGGLCGERKSSILDQAGPDARPWIAPYVVLATGRNDMERFTAALAKAGLALPLVVKPNIGCNGTGVRLVRSLGDLEAVLAQFPRDVELMCQALVPSDGEAGIFYVREPGSLEGRITSLTFKTAPSIVGDGRRTIAELVMSDGRASQLPHLYLPRLGSRAEDILEAGQSFQLVFAGNHCKGSIFTDGHRDISRALVARIDTIMKAIPDLNFGRLDVKFDSIAALRNGSGFRIIEINGVGSEATHIWDPSTTLRQAYADQFRHYRLAFRIGNEMRRRGARPTPLIELLSFWRLQRRLMASYPLND